LQRGAVERSGGLPYIEENVVAPDALCFADDPASGAGPFGLCEEVFRGGSGFPAATQDRQDKPAAMKGAEPL
jgi:hypothetical protein